MFITHKQLFLCTYFIKQMVIYIWKYCNLEGIPTSISEVFSIHFFPHQNIKVLYFLLAFFLIEAL